MVNEYFEENIEIDSGKLLKAVLKESAGKQLTTIVRSLSPQDQQVTVEELTNDIKISIGLDPFQARKVAHALKRNKFVVPVHSAEIQFNHDDYQRINKTKNPVSALIADVSIEFSDIEDAYILTATDVTIGDNEGIMESGKFSDADTELNVSTYSLGLSSLAGLIGQAVKGNSAGDDGGGMKGEVRKNPLILVITPIVESLAAGVFNSTSGGDRSILEAWDSMLKMRGGPGSGILVAERLGCSIDFSDPSAQVVTNADESSVGRAALVVVTPKVMGTWASAFDQRPRPYNKADGYYNKVVERWLNLIHDIKGIIASHAVVLA